MGGTPCLSVFDPFFDPFFDPLFGPYLGVSPSPATFGGVRISYASYTLHFVRGGTQIGGFGISQNTLILGGRKKAEKRVKTPKITALRPPTRSQTPILGVWADPGKVGGITYPYSPRRMAPGQRASGTGPPFGRVFSKCVFWPKMAYFWTSRRTPGFGYPDPGSVGPPDLGSGPRDLGRSGSHPPGLQGPPNGPLRAP